MGRATISPLDFVGSCLVWTQRRRLVMAGLAALLIVSLIVGLALQRQSHGSHGAQRGRVAVASPTFVPHQGDTDDAGTDLTIVQGAVPTFQYQSGGYTLTGSVVDAQTGVPLASAVVWLSVAPTAGVRTAPALRVVSGASGIFTFTHLAQGTYTLAAARAVVPSGRVLYPEQATTGVQVPQAAPAQIALTPQAAPGRRDATAGGARNLIILDVSGIYGESWFDDPALQLVALNVRGLAATGARATSVSAPYGWHPADQYALLSGTYPAWRAFDPWPQLVAWGVPDGMDTTFWYSSPPEALTFGQESLFDVAQSYGMSTATLGSPEYALDDVSTHGVQTAQVGLVFDSAGWLAAAQHLIATMRANPSGFVFYGELDPPFGPAGSAGAVPDAPGGAYARAMGADDELVGLLRDWLAREGLLATTTVLVTASEAQINETNADNYYGLGAQGRGSSLDVPLVLAGPGIAPGAIARAPVSTFAVAATALRALCLPPPAHARAPAVAMLFSGSC